MTNLTSFVSNGIEIYIDTATGESFASVSGYARMSGKNKSTISRRLHAVASDTIKTAEIHTSGGLQTVKLIPENLIVEWLPDDNPKTTKSLIKLGVRLFLHKLAGYEIKSTSSESVIHDLEYFVSMAKRIDAIKEERMRARCYERLNQQAIAAGFELPTSTYTKSVKILTDISPKYDQILQAIYYFAKKFGQNGVTVRELQRNHIARKLITNPTAISYFSYLKHLEQLNMGKIKVKNRSRRFIVTH